MTVVAGRGREPQRMCYVDQGRGPAVVLVHGSPVSAETWRQQLPHLAAHHRVIAPDLLGFGESSAPKQGAGFALQASALGSLIDQLELGRFALVGHDWGGPIAAAAGAERAAHVRQLVWVNTSLNPAFRPPWYWRPFVSPLLGGLVVNRLNLVGRVLPSLMQAAKDPAVRRFYQRALRRPEVRRTVLALEQLHGYAEAMNRVAAVEAFFNIDTLLLWGTPDPYFARIEMSRLRNRFRRCRVVELARAGHFPQEDDPDSVTSALQSFLE